MDKDFWKKKPLAEFTEEEWEALCMRCGKCCLHKDGDDKMVYFSNQMCRNFDFKTGKCSCYQNRLGPDCAKVDMHLIQTAPELLPETCAYRLLNDGKPLPDWHPLVSGDENSAHKAGKTVLEMEKVCSIGPLEDAKRDMFERGVREQWSSRQWYRENKKLYKKYKIIYLEQYVIPKI